MMHAFALFVIGALALLGLACALFLIGSFFVAFQYAKAEKRIQGETNVIPMRKRASAS